MTLDHSIALDVAQIQIVNFLKGFRESLVYSLLRANPR